MPREEYHPVSNYVYPTLRSRGLPLFNTRQWALIDLILMGDFGNGAVADNGRSIADIDNPALCTHALQQGRFHQVEFIS